MPEHQRRRGSEVGDSSSPGRNLGRYKLLISKSYFRFKDLAETDSNAPANYLISQINFARTVDACP